MTSHKVFYCMLASFVIVSAYKEDVRRVLQSCKNGQEVTDEELEEFIKPMIPTTYDEKCLMACAFKAYNVINVGVYDPKIALAVGQQMLKNEPEKAQKLKEVITHCGDDIPKKMENECELAGEIMQCLVKYEKAALGTRMADWEESETDGESSRITLTPNMIISGGKLAVKMLMSNVVKGLEGVIHGVNNVLGVAVDFGFDMIKPKPTESDY